MAEITMNDINGLRTKFGIGIYDAKRILELAQGNGELAIEMAKVQAGKEMLHLTEMLKTPTDDQRILNLERENADLRLQLERGVKLREELAEALEVFAVKYQWRYRPDGMLPYEISCRSLYHKYVAIQEAEHESAQHHAAYERLEVKPNHFGYGILDKNDRPAWSEMCVCEDADPLSEEIERLTDWYPDLAPYRVVELQWIEVQP
jgi:hypothetical protein